MVQELPAGKFDTAEKTFYGSLVDSEITGVQDFKPEDFIPCQGTILVVLAPVITQTDGGLQLPDGSQGRPCIAKVAAIPPASLLRRTVPPARLGDLVIFREDTAQKIPFGRREDIAILQYSDDATSDILGVIPKEVLDNHQQAPQNEITTAVAAEDNLQPVS